MKKTKIAIIFVTITAIFIGVLYYLIYEDDINANGKLYPTKQKLCIQFAQSYLRTIQKVEPEFNTEKWQMAIDIETEMYNLCLLELNRESLGKFNASALEKY